MSSNSPVLTMTLQRRELLAQGMAVGAALVLPAGASAQTAAPPSVQATVLPVATAEQVRNVMQTFAKGKTPKNEGLLLDIATLADNPSAVPVRVAVQQPITEQRWCESLILVAERNPSPLACTLNFYPATGTAEAAVRLRLAQSQTVHALARMSDGEVLHAQQEVTVAASGCGM